jgi:hypothetical protein
MWPDKEEVDMPIGADQPGIQVRVRTNDLITPANAGQKKVVKELTTIIPTASVNVLSTSTLVTNREITTSFTRELDNTIIDNVTLQAPGAFLQIDLNIGDGIVYIPDTTKFKPNGKLLVGNEVISYPRKIEDRFLFCQRGIDGTQEQFWPAGTFVLQLQDYVSVVPGGINVISSISSTAGPTAQPGAEIRFQRTSGSGLGLDPLAIVTFEKTFTEFLIFTPPSGIIDVYQEDVFWTNPVSTRNNGFVTLTSKTVTQRSGTLIDVKNSEFTENEYKGTYSIGNLGSNIGNWNGSLDDGTANVSGWTIQQFDRYFSDVSIRDFTDRANSNFTRSGIKWNLANPSFQNPVAIVQTTAAVVPSISVQDTTYFPSSGYLFTSAGSVIQYTSTTPTTFEGCTVIRGASIVSSGDEIVPHELT